MQGNGSENSNQNQTNSPISLEGKHFSLKEVRGIVEAVILSKVELVSHGTTNWSLEFSGEIQGLEETARFNTPEEAAERVISTLLQNENWRQVVQNQAA